MTDRTILITGATGLLGSSLAPHLLECGYRVLRHARATYADVMFDLSDRTKCYSILEKIRPSVIVNLAGLTSVELCEDQVNLAYIANTRTVENLVYWIASSGVKCHLLQVSTDHVYDGVGPHAEDEIAITNNYAFSKYAGEMAAVLIPSTVLRTNFVGRSNISHRESLTDWAYKCLTRRLQLQVLDDVYFSPLSITSLVDLLALAVQKRPIGIYNLGSSNGMSKADFVFAFAECLGLGTSGITRIHANQAKFLKTYRPRDMRMDSAKFENTLGVRLPELRDLIQPLAREYDDDTRFNS